MEYTPKNVLVTGGAGFIGSNFIRYLLNNYDNIKIVNVDKLTYAGNLDSLKDVEDKFSSNRYFFYKRDILDEGFILKILEKFKIDTIVNFAAESHVDRSILSPEPFFQTNTLGTLRLLEVSRKFWAGDKNVRFHHISTDEVYGTLGEKGSFSEKSCYKPSSPYSASKAAADHIVFSYFKTFDVPVTITNSSNNYGPYQYPEKLIPLTIINCLLNKRIPIYGRGENIRNWIYVIDNCDGIDFVIRKGKIGESYNIASNDELKNIDLVTKICKIMDNIKPAKRFKSYTELIYFVKDRPGHDFRYSLDFTKIMKSLNWKPKTKIENGLEKTVKWYIKNESWWNKLLNKEYSNYYKKWYEKREKGDISP